MNRWLRYGEQPGLREMLDDPMVELLMARDGVTAAEVEELIRTLRSAPASQAGAAQAGPAALAGSLER